MLVPRDPATNGILLHAIAGPVDLTGLTLASDFGDAGVKTLRAHDAISHA